MRVVDALAAFPPLILAMAVTVGLGVGLTTAALGIMLSCIPFFARLMRGDIMRIRALPFVEASVALGVPLSGRPIVLLAILLIVVGVQLVSIGLLGELVVRTYHESQEKPIYRVRTVLEAPSELTSRNPAAKPESI